MKVEDFEIFEDSDKTGMASYKDKEADIDVLVWTVNLEDRAETNGLLSKIDATEADRNNSGRWKIKGLDIKKVVETICKEYNTGKYSNL